MLIPRLNDIEKIISLENNFEQQYGIRPYNISSWKVESQFRNNLLSKIDIPQYGNIIDYLYSYSIPSEVKDKIIRKFGFKGQSEPSLVLTPNNTISIVNIGNLLLHYGLKKVCVVNPSYFSIANTLQMLGIPYGTESMKRVANKYVFPFHEILAGSYDAIWITSPIYSTGKYLDKESIEQIQSLLSQNIFVIADESFALNGYELVRQIDLVNNFIAIYSPHKSISCNGLKFSGILATSEHEDFLDQWVDVLCGNLPHSSSRAALHFISDNFDVCQENFLEQVNNTYQGILPSLTGSNIKIDKDPLGSLFMIYCDTDSFSRNTLPEFYNNLFKKTYSSFYPGYLNGFGRDFKLCFRANLALDSINFRQSLHRVIMHLNDLHL